MQHRALSLRWMSRRFKLPGSHSAGAERAPVRGLYRVAGEGRYPSYISQVNPPSLLRSVVSLPPHVRRTKGIYSSNQTRNIVIVAAAPAPAISHLRKSHARAVLLCNRGPALATIGTRVDHRPDCRRALTMKLSPGTSGQAMSYVSALCLCVQVRTPASSAGAPVHARTGLSRGGAHFMYCLEGDF